MSWFGKKKKPKHVWTEAEERRVYEALTTEERGEYNGLVLGNTLSGPHPANEVRLRELTNIGYARLAEGTDEEA